MSSAGDGNSDGNGDGIDDVIDDVIVGSYRASPNNNSDAGTSYVVYGRGPILTVTKTATVNASGLNGKAMVGDTIEYTINAANAGTAIRNAVVHHSIDRKKS